MPGVTTAASAARREAELAARGRLWVADVATVAGCRAPLCLAAVIDRAAGRCLARRTAERADAALVAETVKLAAEASASTSKRLATRRRCVALTPSPRCRRLFPEDQRSPPLPGPSELADRFNDWLRSDLLLAAAWPTRERAIRAIGEWIHSYNAAITPAAITLRHVDPAEPAP